MNTRPAWCAVLNVRASFLIHTSNGTPREHSPFSRHVLRSSGLARVQRDPPVAEAFGNSLPARHWPETPQPIGQCSPLLHALNLQPPVLPNFFLYRPTTPSCGIDNALLFLQQCMLFLNRWRMTQHPTVEDQVIDIVRRVHVCDFEEVVRQCADLTWNQIFLAVDRLSRRGEIRLVPRGRGMYTVAFPHRLKDRPD